MIHTQVSAVELNGRGVVFVLNHGGSWSQYVPGDGVVGGGHEQDACVGDGDVVDVDEDEDDGDGDVDASARDELVLCHVP